MLELKLRHWLKDVLGDSLEWVEPSRGSSVGVGDANIKTPRGGALSVELKVWKTTKKGLCCDMRPAQIRYHYMTWYRKKVNTIILFADERNLFVLAGKHVPKDKYKNDVVAKRILVGEIGVVVTKSHLFKSIVRAINID